MDGETDARQTAPGDGRLPPDRRRVRLPALAVDDPLRAGRRQHRLPPLPRDAPLPPRHAAPRVRLRPLRDAGLSHGRDVHAGVRPRRGDLVRRRLAADGGRRQRGAARARRRAGRELQDRAAHQDASSRRPWRRAAPTPTCSNGCAGTPAGPERRPPAFPRETGRRGRGRTSAPRPAAPSRRAARRRRGSPTSPARPASRARSSTTTTSPRTRCCWPLSSGPTSTPAGSCHELRQRDVRPDGVAAPHHRPGDPVGGRAARRVRPLDRDLGAGASASAAARRVRRHVRGAGPASSSSWSRRGRRPECSAPWRRPRRSPSAWSRSPTA